MSGKARHYERPYYSMVYGTRYERHPEPAVERRDGGREMRRESGEIMDLGRMAVRGVATVGVVGITASMMGGILGGFQK